MRLAIVATLVLTLVGCTPLYRNHGWAPTDENLAEISVGVDTRATVEDVIGVPSAQGVLAEGAYYYVERRVRTFGPFEPTEIDRQVVAISFDARDVVTNIERFGLEDGRVITLSRRVTDTTIQDRTFLRQLLGNLGNFRAGDFIE